MSFDYSLVRQVKPDFAQINKILKNASKLLTSSALIVADSSEGAFSLSYEAMLKVTLALMLSNGLRPRIRLGHHKTLTSYAEAMLGRHSADVFRVHLGLSRVATSSSQKYEKVTKVQKNE